MKPALAPTDDNRSLDCSPESMLELEISVDVLAFKDGEISIEATSDGIEVADVIVVCSVTDSDEPDGDARLEYPDIVEVLSTTTTVDGDSVLSDVLVRTNFSLSTRL